MDIGTRVELVTFNGRQHTPAGCRPDENYWLLLGRRGCVLGFSAMLNRPLVRFDQAVAPLGLHCHNPVPDSLYILASDLAVVADAID